MAITYYLYQITNLINGKIYVGVHKTHNLQDGYMGSGILVTKAIAKYGLENFEKRILQTFETEHDMYQREAEVVTSSFVEREDTYNLTEGGHCVGLSTLRENGRKSGRLTYERGTGLYSPIGKLHCREATKIYQKSEAAAQHRAAMCEAAKSPEAAAKRKATMAARGHSRGCKNNSFGKHWIHKGTENRLVPRGEPLPEGWQKGRKLK